MALSLYGYFNHYLKEIELERTTFLNTLTNKLSGWIQQLSYEMEMSCYIRSSHMANIIEWFIFLRGKAQPKE